MEDKELVVSRARNAVISRDFEMAARLYNSLLREEPANEKYLEALGNIYIKTGNDEKAIPYFESILEKSPRNFNALNSIGGIYRRLKIYDEAIIVLKKALEIDKNNPEINYNLGFTYKSMGKTDEAIDCFETVIDFNPSDVLAYNHLASIYAEKHDYTKAIATYKKGLQIDPNHPILQYNLAKAYQAIHDDASAVAAFETALRAKPGWTDAVKDYSEVLLSHRKTRAAADLVRNAIELHPKNAELYTLQGRIFLRQYYFDGAIQALENADKLSPKNSTVLSLLAEAYCRRGKKADAVNTILEAEIADNFPNASVQKKTISILLTAGKYEQALSCLKKVSAENKNDAELLDLAGQYYITQKKDDSVNLCCEKIKKSAPDYELYLLHWAKRYNEAGDNEKSRSMYMKYLESNNKDACAWVDLACLDEEIGNNAEAEDEYSTALAFDPANYAAKLLLKKLCEKRREQQELQEEEPNDFDLGDYIEQSEQENDELAETLLNDTPEMEDINILEFDDSVTPEEKPEEEPEEENTEEQEETEEPEEQLVDNDIPVESMLDYPDDALSLTDELVDEKDDTNEEPADDEETEPQEEEQPEQEEQEEPKEEKPQYPVFENTTQRPPEQSQEPFPFMQENKDTGKYTEGKTKAPEDKGFDSKDLEDKTDFPADDIFSGDDAAFEETPVVQDSADYDEPAEIPEEERIPEKTSSPYEMPEPVKTQEPPKQNPAEAFENSRIAAEAAVNAAKAAQAATSIASTISSAEEYIKTVADKAARTAAEKAAEEAAVRTEETAGAAAEKLTKIADDIQERAASLQNHIDSLKQNQIDSAAKELEQKFENSVKPEFEPDEDPAVEKYNSLMQQVENILPVIGRMLENKELAQKFNKEVLLFKQLREMGDSLPDENKRQFLLSKTRLLLDFLIARLSGKPGLLKTSKSLRKTGIIDDLIEETEEDDNIPVTELTEKVLVKMQELAKNLPDQTMAQGLLNLSDEVIEKL